MRLWSRVENDYREALSAERYAEGFFFFFKQKRHLLQLENWKLDEASNVFEWRNWINLIEIRYGR